MENGQKAIMIGVGVFITILIISIVILITNLGTGMSERGATKIGKINSSLEKQIISQYENQTVTGQDVVFAIENYYGDLNGIIYTIKKNGNSWEGRGTSIIPLFVNTSQEQVKIALLDSQQAGSANVTITNVFNTNRFISSVNKQILYKGTLILTTDGYPCGLAFIEI